MTEELSRADRVGEVHHLVVQQRGVRVLSLAASTGRFHHNFLKPVELCSNSRFRSDPNNFGAVDVSSCVGLATGNYIIGGRPELPLADS